MRIAVIGVGLIGGSIALAARERLDVEVSVVPGSDRNIKITKPTDMELAHLFLREENGRVAR